MSPRKPRIKKPFPDVVDNGDCSKIIRMGPDTMVKSIDSNFSHDTSMISDAEVIPVTSASIASTGRINGKDNLEHRKSLFDTRRITEENRSEFNRNDENNHKSNNSVNNVSSVTQQRLSPEPLQPLLVRNLGYPSINELGGCKQNYGKMQVFPNFRLVSTRDYKVFRENAINLV